MKTLISLPNILSLSRLPLGAFFIYSVYLNSFLGSILALIILIAATLTDFYDGKLARKNSQVTTFGKWIDPISDFLFFLMVIIAFYNLNLIPLYILILFLIRECSMYLIIRPLTAIKKLNPGAKPIGKAKTVIQFFSSLITLFLLLAFHGNYLITFNFVQLISTILFTVSMLVSVISLYWYIKPLINHK